MGAVQHVAVLAGGRSSRMGVDKAEVHVGGMMMLERIVRTVMKMVPVGKILVVGRDHKPEGWAGDLNGVRFLADRGEMFAGPVGGVVTALEFVNGAALVVGCDTPLISEGTLRSLMGAHEGGRWATMAVSRDEKGEVYGEPTMAVYTPAILPRLREMMRMGRKSFQPLLNEALVGRWEVPREAAGEMLNVNDAETLAEAELRLKGKG